jgi:hypothetical protein
LVRVQKSVTIGRDEHGPDGWLGEDVRDETALDGGE